MIIRSRDILPTQMQEGLYSSTKKIKTHQDLYVNIHYERCLRVSKQRDSTIQTVADLQ